MMAAISEARLFKWKLGLAGSGSYLNLENQAIYTFSCPLASYINIKIFAFGQILYVTTQISWREKCHLLKGFHHLHLSTTI